MLLKAKIPRHECPRSWPSVMAPWVSGPRWRSHQQPDNSGAGCTKTIERTELPAEVAPAKNQTGFAKIWQANTGGHKAFDLFLVTYEPKYPKRPRCTWQRIRES